MCKINQNATHRRSASLFFQAGTAGAFVLLSLPPAQSHPVIVDGHPGEWVTSPPLNQDAGHLGRVGTVGEYAWRDRAGDERTDVANPDPSVDLISFQMTADPTALSFIALFNGMSVTSGDGAPMIQIAIDRTPQSGTLFFAGFSQTDVSPDARWERLIATRFGSGSATGVVYDETFAPVGTASQAISPSFKTIEISVPWSSLGGLPTAPLRFTIAVFRADASDGTWDIGGPGVSNAFDVLTNYGNPGSAMSTADEVADLDVDYHFEVWFHLDPDFDPFAPILLSEVFYDTPGIDSHEEWIELYNASGVPLSLTDWRIGDEESHDGSEGMFRFPAQSSVNPNEVSVMALRSSGFQALNGGILPNFEMINTVIFVPDMIAEPLWATGTIEMSNFGDEILLLDPFFTAVDVATYENGNYPGVNRSHGVVTGESMERELPLDTNDCVVDFRTQPIPTPGEPWLPAVSAPVLGSGAAQLSLSPNPARSETAVRFELKAAQQASVAIFDIQGRLVRTLVDGELPSGPHEFLWDGRSSAGASVSSGVYVVRLISPEGALTRRVTFIH
jgi:hypothetical protein